MKNNNNDYICFCHFGNLASFLSAGFVYSDSIGSNMMQYYKHSITNTHDKIQLFHRNCLPKLDNIEQLVALNIGDIFNKNNVLISRNKIYTVSKKRKIKKIKRRPKQQSPIFVQNLLPITLIKNVYFFDEESKTKFFQMKYKNQLNLDEELFAVNQKWFLGDQNDIILDKEESINNSCETYRKTSKQIAEHLIVMNYVMENNEYTRFLDNRVPNSFHSIKKKFDDSQQSLTILLNLIQQDDINFEYLRTDPISVLSEKEWIFFLSFWKIIRENKQGLSIQEEREGYVDVKRQFIFSIQEVKKLGAIVKKYFPKNDIVINTLALIVTVDLDLYSSQILLQLKEIKSKLLRDLVKLIYSLVRYGKSIKRIRNILRDSLDCSELINILPCIIIASYMGIEKLPVTIKQPLNWRFAYDSFVNMKIPIAKSFPKKKKNVRLKWELLKSAPWTIIKSDDIITYKNKQFRLLYQNIKYTISNGVPIGCFPIMNKHGFIYEIKESQNAINNHFYYQVMRILSRKFVADLPAKRLSELFYKIYNEILI